MYKTIEELPREHKRLFEHLVLNGIVKEDCYGNINISKDVYEMILILFRLGILL